MSDGDELDAVPYADLDSPDAWEHVVAAVTDVLLTLDGDGTIRSLVDDQPATLGYTAADLVGTSVTSLFARGVAPASVFDVASPEQFQRALFDDGTDTVTAPLETTAGSTVPLELTTLSPPETTALVCVGRTVGSLVEGVGPRHSETRLLDDVPDPVYILDADGHIEYVNDALVAYTGYDPAKLRGRDVSELIPPTATTPGHPEQFDLDAPTDQRSSTVETTIITSDGERILTEAHVTALTERGSYAGALGVLRDIRQRKHREQNLDLLKQVLTRVFRHNIRNELVVARGHTEHLAEHVDDDLRRHTEKIRATTDRLLSHSEKARLIEEVIDTDERHELDLTAEVSAVVTDVRDEYPGATIDVDVPSDATARAHPDISMAIQELLENAIEHAPEDATPRIDVWIEQHDETTTLFVEDESGGLADQELTVLDRGVESDLEHGSGVGLWLIRWLVEYSAAQMIAHPTEEGSLMGVRFAQRDVDEATADGPEDSPLARTPAHVREVSPETFHGDTIIGHVDALGTLEDVYDSIEGAGGHSVLLTGEAGIGKTTLIEQFRDRLADRADDPVIASGSCPSDVQSSYHAFRQAMDDLPTDHAISDIFADTASLDVDDAEDLEQRKRAMFADIADELRDVAEKRPVVLLVEDMHWADRGTVDLFEYLVRAVGRWGHPVLFLGTYRTSGVDRTHPVLEVAERTADAGRGTVVELDPFDAADVRSLVADMLQLDDPPASFVDAVHDHTGGTPLFVNELTRHLAETLGPIETGADLPDDLGGVTVPETVEEAVAERLDELPEMVDPVLRLGAVIGTGFSFDLLRETSDLSVDTLVECTNTLTRRQVWQRSSEGLQFVHGVVREQTLEGVPDDERGRLHAAVAAGIETVYADALDEYAGRLGFHYEQVADYETAFEYYRRAGAYETDRYAQQDAIAHYERALSLADDHDVASSAELADVSLELGNLNNLLSEYDRAREWFERSLERARAANDPDRQAKSLNRLGSVVRNRDDYERAVEYYEESLAISRDHGLRKRQAWSLTRIGSVLGAQGAFDDAEEYVEDGLAIAEEIGDRGHQATSLLNLGLLAAKRGRYDSAEEYYERTLSIAEETSARHTEATTLNNLSLLCLNRGQYQRALEYQEESHSINRDIGDRPSMAENLSNLGLIAKARREYRTAQEYLEESLATTERIGNQRGEANTLNNLGNIAMLRGRYDQATEYYRRGLEIWSDIGDPQGEAIKLVNLGNIARHRGEYGQAYDYYRRGLEITRDIGDRQTEAVLLTNLGQTHRSQGELNEAQEYVERGLDVAEEMGSKKWEAESLKVLGGITKERSELERSRTHLRDALDIATEVGATPIEVATRRELGAVARQQERYQQAAQHLNESLDACREDEHRYERATTTLERGKLALARGDSETAREAVDKAQDVFTDLDATHGEARATLLRGRIAAATGSPATAREHWREALATLEDVGAPGDELEALRYLAETCRSRGDDARVAEYEDRARKVFETAPDPVRAIHESWIGV